MHGLVFEWKCHAENWIEHNPAGRIWVASYTHSGCLIILTSTGTAGGGDLWWTWYHLE